MKTKIYKSKKEFNEREDKTENGVSVRFSKIYADFENQNKTNEGCFDCSHCSHCSGCFSCFDCSRCFDKKEIKDNFKVPIVPKIENIHAKVFAAASQPGAFNMSDWHTCETTHCRAGWVVYLAGEVGKNLEKFHNTALAAQLIYKESGSPINPCRFFDSNEDALADMKKCAELETEKK